MRFIELSLGFLLRFNSSLQLFLGLSMLLDPFGQLTSRRVNGHDPLVGLVLLGLGLLMNLSRSILSPADHQVSLADGLHLQIISFESSGFESLLSVVKLSLRGCSILCGLFSKLNDIRCRTREIDDLASPCFGFRQSLNALSQLDWISQQRERLQRVVARGEVSTHCHVVSP